MSRPEGKYSQLARALRVRRALLLACPERPMSRAERNALALLLDVFSRGRGRQVRTIRKAG